LRPPINRALGRRGDDDKSGERGDGLVKLERYFNPRGARGGMPLDPDGSDLSRFDGLGGGGGGIDVGAKREKAQADAEMRQFFFHSQKYST